MQPEEVDVVVLGAGISGIASAKFYLEIHPECRLVVLEQDSCLGGVFSEERIYPHFWTQWTVGQAEFSDVPMSRPLEDDIFYEFFKSKYTTQYLNDYADRQKFAGKSLRERIRFSWTAKKIDKRNGRWIISGTNPSGEGRVLHASKLMVASGLASTSSMPSLPGIERFQGPVLHQREFGSSTVLSTPDIQHITVIGGAKSAADMIYAAVKAGKSVSWVHRPSGSGPGFFVSPKGKGPYKNAYEIGSTRLASTFTPSLLIPDTYWARFLHQTTVGNKIISSLWNAADQATRKDGNFENREARKGFATLTPHTPFFWQNGSGGLLNRADFWEIIAQNVEIYHDEIFELKHRLVRLKSGEEIRSDAILCGTGWTPSLDFFDQELRVKLGLPHRLEDNDFDRAQKWAELEKEAEQAVLNRFALLKNPPPHHHKSPTTTPYRLHRGIAPLHDDSIVFINHVVVSNKWRAAECQAIWATAYLDKLIALPTVEKMEAEIALNVAFSRLRYLSNGELGHCMTFETIGYTDQLLEDIGMSSHRRGWFSDFFQPCTARDFRGLREEYICKYGSGSQAESKKA